MTKIIRADAGTASNNEKLPAISYNAAGLWDIHELMRHLPVCRRSIANLRRKGMPCIKLGARIFFHPESTMNWLLRQRQGQVRRKTPADTGAFFFGGGQGAAPARKRFSQFDRF